MAKKKKKPIIETSLGDLLFQKNMEHGGGGDAGPEFKALREEKRRLEQENDKQTIEAARQKDIINDLRNERSQLPDALFKSALKNLKQENFIDAMGFLQAVIILEPENLKALNNLALVYSELGYADKARETLNLVLEKDPENEVAKKNIELIC